MVNRICISFIVLVTVACGSSSQFNMDFESIDCEGIPEGFYPECFAAASDSVFFLGGSSTMKGEKALLLKTVDKGRHWITTFLGKGSVTELKVVEGKLFIRNSFYNPETQTGAFQNFCSSDDFGSTWDTIAYMGEKFSMNLFLTKNVFYLSVLNGKDEKSIKTNDGGLTWVADTLLDNFNVNSFYLSDGASIFGTYTVGFDPDSTYFFEINILGSKVESLKIERGREFKKIILDQNGVPFLWYEKGPEATFYHYNNKGIFTKNKTIRLNEDEALLDVFLLNEKLFYGLVNKIDSNSMFNDLDIVEMDSSDVRRSGILHARKFTYCVIEDKIIGYDQVNGKILIGKIK
ncbi:MAG: hypothetical protein NT150_07605 [Bacteroidetes bacterium]|nr:hypothetical protein [Bacteroidota bacterium]